MSSVVSYMGTKEALAGRVAAIARELPEGPLLDVFSGMGAVAKAVAPRRQVWVNDWLVFPALVSRTLMTSRCGPLERSFWARTLTLRFQRNMKALRSRFSHAFAQEQRFLGSETIEAAHRANTCLSHVGTSANLERTRRRLALKPTTFPYRLATISYRGAFFGVAQSAELDSIRFALDDTLASREIDRTQHSWALVALCRAAARVNTSTGQFAEFMRPTEDNLKRFVRQRHRSVWDEFLLALEALQPVPTRHRTSNRAFRSDATQLLRRLRRNHTPPAVVYADPPYSKAQYSRYYHVLDELITYRYPPISRAGRYPDKRRRSSYGLASKVEETMRNLVSASSELGSALVLSYPSNGLLIERRVQISRLLREHYSHVELAHSSPHKHSSFGGPSADSTVAVRERVYVASN